MNNFKFEIEYFYQPSKDNGPRTHWMYFQCKAKTLEAGKELAHKHYTTRMRELGWTSFTTLSEIRPPKRANDPPNHKTVSNDTGSKSPSSTSNGGTKRRGNSIRKRKTGTTKRKSGT